MKYKVGDEILCTIEDIPGDLIYIAKIISFDRSPSKYNYRISGCVVYIRDSKYEKGDTWGLKEDWIIGFPTPLAKELYT